MFLTRRARSLTTRVAVFAAVSLAMLGCAPAKSDLPPEPTPVSTEIAISGTGDEVPTFDFETPFPVVEPRAEVLWRADGDRIEDGQPILVRLVAADGKTGDIVRNDFDSVPAVLRMDPKQIGSQMFEVLSGLTFGSRVMLVSTDEDTSQITVADVFASCATGTDNAPEAQMPTVTYGAAHEPNIEIAPDLEAPQALQVQQLKIGRGPQVDPGSTVVLQFVGVAWSTGKVFDTTWGPESLPVAVTVGEDYLIQGLDENLVGVPVGSQIMVVVPPDLGFGPTENELAEETLVYVVDILAASAGPSTEPSGE